MLFLSSVLLPALLACGVAGPGVLIEKAFSADLVLDIEAMVSSVEQSGDRDFVNQSRTFGEEKEYVRGSVLVTFLHEHAKLKAQTLVDRLWALALVADERASWGFAGSLVAPGRPGLRCLESIKYYSVAADAAAADAGVDVASSQGWHYDGHTLATVAILLTDRGRDYVGGEVQVRHVASSSDAGAAEGPPLATYAPRRGDAVVWRGWDSHRVLPVRRGLRHVLVAEFWTGPDVQGAENRLDDFEQGYRDALTLDHQSASLWSKLSWALYEREEWPEALNASLASVSLDPGNAEAWVLLGLTMQKQGRLHEAMEAFNKSRQLSPGDPLTLMAVAALANEQGDLDEMERCYLQAADAGGWQALEPLGDLRAFQGRHAEAADFFERASSHSPADEGVLAKLQLARQQEREDQSRWRLSQLASSVWSALR